MDAPENTRDDPHSPDEHAHEEEEELPEEYEEEEEEEEEEYWHVGGGAALGFRNSGRDTILEDAADVDAELGMGDVYSTRALRWKRKACRHGHRGKGCSKCPRHLRALSAGDADAQCTVGTTMLFSMGSLAHSLGHAMPRAAVSTRSGLRVRRKLERGITSAAEAVDSVLCGDAGDAAMDTISRCTHALSRTVGRAITDIQAIDECDTPEYAALCTDVARACVCARALVGALHMRTRGSGDAGTVATIAHAAARDRSLVEIFGRFAV